MELFVTDLDGTLLNKNSVVSDQSREILNPLIDNGLQFTIATARTHATVVDLLEGLNIKMPIAVMNGVGIYDMSSRQYLEIVSIEREVVKTCLDIMKKAKTYPLVYTINQNELFVHYEKLTNEPAQSFYESRKMKTLKKFKQVDDVSISLDAGEVVNMLVFDKLDVIQNLAASLTEIKEITVTAYEITTKPGATSTDVYGYLELYSANASKANGIKALLKYVNYDQLVVFGDNLNDLPMFELADEAYATSNGVTTLKEAATAVIGHHDEDAVATYIANRINV